MSIQAVLLPLFVEVILTFVLLYWMAHLRTSAFRKGDINAQDVALREPKFDFRGRAGETSNPLYRGFANQSAEDIERYDQPVLVRLNTRDELVQADDIRGELHAERRLRTRLRGGSCRP